MRILLASSHIDDDRSLIGFLLVMALSGLVVGALGRLLVPGRQPMGILATILAGVAGSVVGGFIARLIFGPEYVPGLIVGALGAALLIWAIYGTNRRHA
ncbi:MAG TPA: GlsB/YeaQ/YmgE family stress response membrane protein [Actinomycetota bacterium]|nr:GlsB/YeaQ/YmgE family stress response membrane protein [Actinomycetota bacterium]